MKKTGELEQDKGKAFITERLLDASAMLGALYASAWAASEPTQKDVDDFVKYDGPAGAGNDKPANEQISK